VPYAPSTESLLALLGNTSGSQSQLLFSTTKPTTTATIPPYQPMGSTPYPAWNLNDPPLSTDEIEEAFVDLTNKFGFQRDNMNNMFDHFMTMLDSRASRMTPVQALHSLHADYIGGPHSNYTKWYFAVQMDAVDNAATGYLGIGLEESKKLWQNKMESLPDEERAQQLILYLLMWGEAATVRYTSECICFLFNLADDYRKGRFSQDIVSPEGDFLETVITPLYRFVRERLYEIVDGKFIKRERDHQDIIGYDDVNQLFWRKETIELLRLYDGRPLSSIRPEQRYTAIKTIDWKSAFQKTYKEKRSWVHSLVNFMRIWIIHITTFWYYMSANSDFFYLSKDPLVAVKEMPVRISVVALGGAVSTGFMLIGGFAEFLYLPSTINNMWKLLRRTAILILIFCINVAPTVFIAYKQRTGTVSLILSLVQLALGIVTTLIFAIIPSSSIFEPLYSNSRTTLPEKTFAASFAPLSRSDRLTSIALWVCVFFCKFLESYFFLTLSFKDPLRSMSSMTIKNCSDRILGSWLCSHMPEFTIFLMFVMDMTLYFLDTYLWYIIWNTIFSVSQLFHMGISIWVPWRNIYSRLPKNIYSKILSSCTTEAGYAPKVLCSQIWNAVIIAMYREHLLSIDHVHMLVYKTLAAEEKDAQPVLKPPTFFSAYKENAFLPKNSEAQRRMAFFAQSLSSTSMPNPPPVTELPTFTVLVPHYGEKILLSLREIIREEDQNTRVTLLEYLKQLHSVEWENFVKDTKILAEETANSEQGADDNNPSRRSSDEKDDLPFYCIGFKSSAPEYTLRTRIWASLRAQTLYRTVAGFMNYAKALKILHRVENPEMAKVFDEDFEKQEHELDLIAQRKFRFLIAMQRYAKFNEEEAENAEYLLSVYPDLQIAYIDEEPPKIPGEETVYYSVLVDGRCDIMENGKRAPKYRVRLPGNPILGDGKSDNQNHALIFYRGEYLQLVDANQDNYLEECFKIRSVFGEFEEQKPLQNPYSSTAAQHPVAIVGAREYIFSENIGVLGDVAAGKEQTFGTLTQRIMAKVGGRLHYGHPDFLNATFMTTRGGVSKGQKGLHLNEDIYAGMNAFLRGGRIKHTEYFQCGKGRDLGFGSILNFTTKIGTGMGEQMLSREYYYLGTRLPLDRFLTFYYAHPGFHINNILIMFAVQIFMFCMLMVGAMVSSLPQCHRDPTRPNGPLIPIGCYNLMPVYDWITRCILSIFMVFFISFLPLFLQELTEKGFTRSIGRLARHFMSLSPLFEVFVTQIYSNAVLSNLNFGGARYIATGRGFATTRIPFSILYSRFAGPSMYFGARILVMLLFVSMTLWMPHLIYFWFSVIALIVSPFVFNPHQFAFTDFIIDYREFLRWLSRGNSKPHANSWIAYCRMSRTRITGYKRKKLGDPSDSKTSTDSPRAHLAVIFFSEIFAPFLQAVFCCIAYLFVKSFDPAERSQTATEPGALLRIILMAIGPIVCNAVTLLAIFLASLVVGCLFGSRFAKFGSVMAGLAHMLSVVTFCGFFEVFWMLENWRFDRVVLGLIASFSIQRLVFKLLIAIFLSREIGHDGTNRGWWTGNWRGRNVSQTCRLFMARNTSLTKGIFISVIFSWVAMVSILPIMYQIYISCVNIMFFSAFTQPFREFVCKIVELSMFTTDFIIGHMVLFILSPFTLVPYIDQLHSMMLFWLRPRKQIRRPIMSWTQRKQRRRIAVTYGLLFLATLLAFTALLSAPLLAKWLGPHIHIHPVDVWV
jgi:1,3-beta-glucan synthase